MKILTTEQMRNVDRRTIREFGIPGMVLMENAGTQVVDTLLERYPDCDPDGVLVLCGKGNNGGDGLVAARHLLGQGIKPRVVLLARAADLQGDAAAQLAIVEKIGLAIVEVPDQTAWDEFRKGLGQFEVIVDAILGTGLQGPVKGFLAAVFSDLNEAPADILAVDIPSGLSGGTSEIVGPSVRADITVAFACPKIPHIFPPAEDLVGEVSVADIGIPEAAVRAEEVSLNLIDEEDLEELMPERDPESHKGQFGHVLVVAGSVGKSGAARMVAEGALRAGAGLVTTATPVSAQATVGSNLMEMMTEGLPETSEGTLSANAVTRVQKLQDGKKVLTVGPGLSMAGETQAAIREIVNNTKLPVILDADGLNAFAGNPQELSGKARPLVITPHPGEMGRLLQISPSEVQGDRLAICRQFAVDHQCYVILKGYRTLLGTPEGQVYVNPTGNPGMATAGSGDVLTGILSGLVAQGIPMFSASLLAVFLHGLAADLAAEQMGEICLMAGDILDFLPDAFGRLSD